MKTRDSIYNRMSKLAMLTMTTILAGKPLRAQKIMSVAERLITSGNDQAKRAVANVYVYQISTLLLLHHLNPRTILPLNLQKEYVRQSNAC